MRKVLFRYACLGLVLVLCLPLVACDMKMGGLIGKLLEILPEISDDQMGQIEDGLTEEDILHGVPVPDYTTPDYSYHDPETNVPDYTYDYPETTNPDYTYPDQTEEWVTETQPPYETEEPTIDDIPPMPDPVLMFASIDEGYTMIGHSRNDQFFMPGQFMEWNKVAKIDDYTVESIGFFGWAAFTSEDIGVFGYQIDEQEPVFDTAFWFEAEEPVWQAALSMGAKSASRMNFVIPVRDLSGAHTIRLLAKDQVGTIDTMAEFTIIKAEDPNAPVLMLDVYDIAESADQYSSQVGSASISDDGTYVTLHLDIQGHPFADPFINILPHTTEPYATGGQYLVMKYRTTESSAGGEFFVGSDHGPHGGTDEARFDYQADGRWHTLILDLNLVEAVNDTYDINFLRYDIYNNSIAPIDIGYIALFRSEEAALAYDAEHPYVNSYSVDMNRPENQDFYKESWPDAGIENDLCVLAYNQAIYCGSIDLSQWSYAVIEYTSDASDITKEAYEKSSSLAIGFKDQASSYGQENTDNFEGDIAHSEMIYSENYWSNGLRTARIDLSDVAYHGEVWATVHNPQATIIAITSITFYE